MTLYRSLIEAAKWAGAQKLIRDLAWMYNLELDLQVDRGWFLETVRFSVRGDSDKVALFRDDLSEAILDYQRRISEES